MTIDDKIRDKKNYNLILTEKHQNYQHLSSGKIEKYEYLTCEKNTTF